ncbi:MAG: sensor histidine kinase [Bacteroidia bacterium]|nr:sensor histidine kinase [Bacteroidia bacterium]
MKILVKIKGLQFYLWMGAVWLLLWILSAALNNSETFVTQSLNEIWRAIFIVVVNFIFFEYSLSFITRKRSNILFNIVNGILLISLQFVLVSFGLFGWKYLGMQLHIFTSFRQVTMIPDTPFNYFMEDVFYQAQGGVTSLFFFGIAKLFNDNFKLKQAAQKLRLEKQEAELNYLKSQTNPHFLFNTLNNIYSLSRDKSDLAPESILRLSKILRFMLYETSGEFISVEQEMEIISDYIELEKMRYDDTFRINFKHEVEDLKQPLPPLLLITLVENAFKHGVSETSNKPFVDINVSINKQQLLFVIKNSTENFDGEKNVKENIGLSNLRRQLELLYKENNLTVHQNGDVFTATLKINLASHV